MAAGLVVLGLAVGCNSSQPAGFETPRIASSTAAAEALTLYDKNGNDLLEQDELSACPALEANLAEYDRDGDSSISREELVARFDAIFVRGAELVSITCTVTEGRKPVTGAKVRLVPEEFLGNAVMPASGTTLKNGNANLAIASEQLPDEFANQPVAQIGIYRVEVESGSKKAVFGHEVDLTKRSGMSPTFDLQTAKKPN